MRTTVVDKIELDRIVQTNRHNHRGVFAAAFDAYRSAAKERLQKALDALERGDTPPLHFGLVIPEDHTEDYDTVLLMLEMEQRDEIELTWDEFRNYVQDEWGWTRRFNETTASYGVTK